MVNATTFSYDGVESTNFNIGLMIADFDDNSVTETEAFSPSLSTLKVPQLLRFYHAGCEYDSLPTFQFSVIAKREIPAELRSAILSWLVGRNEFKPLQFHQRDMEGYIYYCVFTGSSLIYVNGACHGFRLTATFDSPFARRKRTYPTSTNGKIYYGENNPIPAGTTNVLLKNLSDVKDNYVYPTVKFKGNISIVNTTDDLSRAFTFAGISSSDTVEVDNETKVITGASLGSFVSKNWLRLRQGDNLLTVISSGGGVVISCPNYAMIGY